MKKIIKISSSVIFILGICYLVKYYNKEDKKLYRYIGKSIIETPNTMPENCTVGQMEYYEHLHEIKN